MALIRLNSQANISQIIALIQLNSAERSKTQLKQKNASKSSPGARIEALSTDFESSRQGASFLRVPMLKKNSQGLLLYRKL